MNFFRIFLDIFVGLGYNDCREVRFLWKMTMGIGKLGFSGEDLITVGAIHESPATP